MSEPGWNEDFEDLVGALLDAGVRFLIVGAHALAVHGVPRATQDLDVWVEASADNARRVMAALEASGAPLRAHGITRADFGTLVCFGKSWTARTRSRHIETRGALDGGRTRVVI